MDHPVVQQFAQAWSNHDGRALQALMADDALYEVVPQGRVFRPDALPEQVSFMESLASDFSVRLVSSLVEQDRCAVEFELSGTNDGPFAPFRLAPSGRPFTIRGMWLFAFAGDRIASCRAYWDFSGLLRQVGVAPPGEVGWQLDSWAEESDG